MAPHGGTTGNGRSGARAATPRGETTVSLARGAAKDYDPQGDDEEHGDEAALALDGDPGTTWTTENYRDDVITGPSGPKGVGLYVDAKPEVAATSMLIQTPKSGWKATIYAAPAGKVPAGIDGWTKVGGGRVAKRKQRFQLDTDDESYRYYLIWITGLPKGAQSVGVGEVSLTQET